MHELIGALDSAVAPALRGDVPEYGIIDALWTEAREGMRDSATQLDRSKAKAKSYAALASFIEAAPWTSISAGATSAKKYLEETIKARGKNVADEVKRANRKARAAKTKLEHAENRLNAKPNKRDRASKEEREENRNRIRDEKLPKAEGRLAKAGEASERFASGAKLAKHAGRVLGVASFGADAIGQWVKDSKNHPHMGTTTKAARAGATATGGLGGAVAGGEAGAAIGSVVPVLGTAIGAAIGAGVGGYLGAGGTSAVLDSGWAKSAGHAAHDAGSEAKKVGHFIAHPHTPW